jgi:hypothetical protein
MRTGLLFFRTIRCSCSTRIDLHWVLRVSLQIALPIVLIGPQNVFSQSDDASSRETLRGLKALSVQVGSSSCDEWGYHAAVLQNDVELQLRMAGIKVLQSGQPALATLGVALFCYGFTGSVKGYAYFQQSEVVQRIPSPFDHSGKVVEVTTWKSFSALGVHNENNASQVRSAINDSVRQFINAWLASNR